MKEEEEEESDVPKPCESTKLSSCSSLTLVDIAGLVKLAADCNADTSPSSAAS